MKNKKIKVFLGVVSSCIVLFGLLFWEYRNTIVAEEVIPLSSISTSIQDEKVISDWVKVPKGALAFVMSFQEEPQEVEIQSRMKEKKLIDWELLPIDDDLRSQDPREYTKMFFLTDTKEIRYRLSRGEVPEGELTWIMKEAGSGWQVADSSLGIEKVNAREDLDIVSRAEAGLDESLRYIDPDSPPPIARQIVNLDPEFIKKYADELSLLKTVSNENGNRMIWPYEYMKGATKIFIHHSAGRMLDCSKDEGLDAFRSIYRYHTVSRGWGDIGYHYVVDPCTGTVYEGRAGGDGVKGAHVGAYNTGSIGLMLMGNYSEEIPSEIAIDALGELAAFVSEKYNIDPTGESMFRGEERENLLGHRDVNTTNCPGNNLYDVLDDIRRIAKREFKKPADYYGDDSEVITQSAPDVSEFQSKQYNAYPFSANANDLFLPAGESISVNVAFKNIGKKAWNSKTYLRIDGDVGVLGFGDGRSQSNVANILESSVASGGLGTFELFIQVPETAVYHAYNFQILPVINGTVLAEHPMDYRILVRGNPGFHSSTASQVTESESDLDSNRDSPNNSVFVDVGDASEFAPYIYKLAEEGIVSKNLYFEPTRPVKRDEFAKLVSRAANLQGGDEAFTYSDVPSSNEFRSFIELLRSNGITAPKDTFFPRHTITRGEAIKILVNAFGLTGDDAWNFQDVAGKVFEPYIKIALANDLVAKKDLFYPNNQLTRDQASKIISLAKSVSGNHVLGSETTNSDFVGPVAYGDLGPLMRVGVGFVAPEIEIQGVEDMYNIYSGSELLFQNVSHASGKVQYVDGMYQVRVNADEKRVDGPVRFVSNDSENGALQVLNWTRPQNEYDGKQDTAFRDVIELVKEADSDNLIVVNELPLEKYLWGLAEQPNDMPHEKNTTIAVAARSYALYYIEHGGKTPGKPYYLNSSANDQVYRGYFYELRIPRFVDAVRSTRAQVVTYQEKVVKVPFFSQSGGYTITPGMEDNIWKPESFRFTQSVEDPWSCGGTFADIDRKLRCPENIRGHRVGVSAKGAEMQAREGKTYGEIIRYYLKDIEIVTRY